MSRKALFFDVDGTLLSEITHTVPESTVRALSETRRRGNLVFINSGRTYGFLGAIKELIESDGFLCGCGTCIVAGDTIIYRYRIPRERGLEIKKAIVSFNFAGVLEGTEGVSLPKEPYWIQRAEDMRESLMKAGTVILDGWEDDDYVFDKFCVIADEKSDREGFFRWLKPDIQVIDRGGDFYECVPAGHSKATAIEWVLNHYGIEKKDAYVFGDSSNDLPMFEYADNAVLMGKHDDVLEPYATFVTKTVEEDGIEYAMKELGLI